MDRFVLKKGSKSDGYKPLIVDVATHEKLMQMKEDSGVPVTKIIAQMTDFCLERLQISED